MRHSQVSPQFLATPPSRVRHPVRHPEGQARPGVPLGAARSEPEDCGPRPMSDSKEQRGQSQAAGSPPSPHACAGTQADTRADTPWAPSSPWTDLKHPFPPPPHHPRLPPALPEAWSHPVTLSGSVPPPAPTHRAQGRETESEGGQARDSQAPPLGDPRAHGCASTAPGAGRPRCGPSSHCPAAPPRPAPRLGCALCPPTSPAAATGEPARRVFAPTGMGAEGRLAARGHLHEGGASLTGAAPPRMQL